MENRRKLLRMGFYSGPKDEYKISVVMSEGATHCVLLKGSNGLE